MNPLCLMECNLKSSMQWEWDNIISFSASTTENPRKPRLLEWEIEGLDSVSICSSGFAGVGSGGLGSDMGHAFSRSSKSTSISSSSIDMKTYNFTSEAAEALPEDLCSSEELAKGIGTSPSLEASFGSSGEPILGLKLGKRTYFEDVCAGTNVKGLKLPVTLTSSASPVKRSKSISQSFQAPRCQVEGCNLDLSSAKHYHRKHRVCDSHSKCPIVVIGGLERRFCQQCSRFHGLNEFDEKKRSCRRRLTDHNARRRKPQPEPMQLNPGLTYDGKQHTNLVWNKFALIDTRREDKFLWEPIIPSSKSMTLRELVAKPSKAENFDTRNLSNNNNLLSSSTMPRKTKITTADLFSKDIEEVTMSSHLGGGSQDLDGALSLLSNATSWDSFESRCVSMDHHLVSNLETETNHAVTHQLNSSFENWQTDVQVLEPTTSNRDSGSQFQLLRGHYNESYFCPNQFN